MNVPIPSISELHAAYVAEARAYRDALGLAPGTLTQVIDHGDYYHRRETVAGPSVCASELMDFLSGSPYVFRMRREVLERMLSEINETGVTELGWGRFYLE